MVGKAGENLVLQLGCHLLVLHDRPLGRGVELVFRHGKQADETWLEELDSTRLT
jgi:hypothetical protein